ncbi:hypothetical protein M0805_003339 [Coniferiporia weirii]|nr:hypothetical protein M0805_003339 [Coniferiporia weirii]
MPSSNNPPQLQLSLGLPPPHHAFKRSFHQFGLDVDDADDAEASSAGSSSGSVSTSASGNAGGSRSVSGSSSSTYSSLASGDAYGHNERNKRARSEGPDGVNSGSSVGSSADAGEQSIGFTGARLGSGSGAGSSGARQRPGQAASQMDAESETPGEYSFLTPSSASSTYVDTPTPSYTAPSLPTPSFGPPTPSIADFAASRIRSSAGGLERPPGFSNMLSPRLSSPAPPPVVDMDIVTDDDEDDISLTSHSFSRPAHQERDPSDSLSLATDLRARIARARAFDRTIAPLRSGAPNAPTALSQSQDVPRPRHPPFDFEAHRRRASPVVSLTMPFGDVRGADANTSVSSDTSNRLFDHGRDYNEQSIVEDNTNYYSRSAHMSSPSSLSDESFASASAPASGIPLGAGRFTAAGDSFANARAANMNANMRRTRRLSPEMEPIRFRSAFASDEDEDGRENDEDEEADDIDVDRALVVHGSETDADAGRTQARDAGAAGGEGGHDFADFGPFDQNWSSHLTSVLENTRPVAHPGPRWDNVVNREQSRSQSREDQTSASSRTDSDVRIRPWPWSPPPPDNEREPNNFFGSSGTQGLSHAPSHSNAAPYSSAPESSSERIGQMVRLDMGMGIGAASSAYPHVERIRSRHVSQRIEVRESRAARAPTPLRPNLPTLRSAIFGSDAQSGNSVSSPETEAIRNRFNELREERAQRAARSRREDSALDAWRSEMLREDDRASETVSTSAISSTASGVGLHLGGEFSLNCFR